MIAPDKLGHIAAGFVIAMLATSVSMVCSVPVFTACLIGVSVAAFVGLLKEAYDFIDNELRTARGLAPRHGVEFTDFLATALGGVLFDGFLASLVVIGRWIMSLMLMGALLLAGGCYRGPGVKLPTLPADPETTGSLIDQRAAILKTRDQLRDKLASADLRLKQADRDLDDEKLRSRQRWCWWIAGLMFVAAAVAAVAAVMLPIPKKLAVSIAISCTLFGCLAIFAQFILPYLVIASIVVVALGGIIALSIIAPKLKALHELANINGIPSLHLSDGAKKGLASARCYVQKLNAAKERALAKARAKNANAETEVFNKVLP